MIFGDGLGKTICLNYKEVNKFYIVISYNMVIPMLYELRKI